jgi:hypothetical protein
VASAARLRPRSRVDEPPYSWLAGGRRNVLRSEVRLFVDQPEAFIVEASDGLKVGKWEVKYPGVDAQFALAGIDPQGPNHWSKVGCE